MRLGNTDVGDLVYLQVSGGDTALRVMHHGKPDDTYDNSFSGGTILMLDYSETPYQTRMVEEVDEYKGDYSGSYMHWVLNSTWLSKLEGAVAEKVVQVKLPYRQGVSSDPYVVASGSQGLAAKVWLPSIVEVSLGAYSSFGTGTGYYITEGARFDYFKGASPSFYSNWKVLDSDAGGDEGWGTRTPGQYGSGAYADFFCKVNVNGEWFSANRNEVHVRPCLVLPDETLVDDSGRITAGVETPVKIGGVWRDGVSWSKIGGVWRKTGTIHKKVDGSWKQ